MELLKDDLGILLGYSIKECSVTHKDMEKFLVAEGLEKFMPRKPHPANVFRRVTSALGGTYHKDDLRYKVDVVKVTERTDPIERVVIAVEIDEENREISEGKKVARMLFNRTDNSFGYITESYAPGLFPEEISDDLSPIPDFIYEEVKGTERKIREQLNYLSPAQIRDVFCNILKSVGIPSEGIPMLWTVHGKKENTVKAFTNLADKINATLDKKAIYYRIENIADTKEKRGVISADAVVYATERFRKFLCHEYEKIESADDPDKALENVKDCFGREADSVVSLIKEYEDIIGDSVKKIEDARKEYEELLKDFEITPNLKAS